MGNQNTNHRQTVLDVLKRRLRERELQAARYGFSADPVIKLEIEDLTKEIRTLEWEMTRFKEDRARFRNEHTKNITESFAVSEGAEFTYQYDLTGDWKLDEIYEFGRTSGEAHIFQNANRLSGFITIHDTMDNGEEIIIQQDITGTVRATTLFLYGTHIRSIRGRADDYELDQWIGIIKDKDLIEGTSEDIDGTTGKFVLKRQEK